MVFLLSFSVLSKLCFVIGHLVFNCWKMINLDFSLWSFDWYKSCFWTLLFPTSDMQRLGCTNSSSGRFNTTSGADHDTYLMHQLCLLVIDIWSASQVEIASRDVSTFVSCAQCWHSDHIVSSYLKNVSLWGDHFDKPKKTASRAKAWKSEIYLTENCVQV